MTKAPKRHRSQPSNRRPAAVPTGQRVTQETIDQMAELRRQGLTFQEIGRRVGRSERTARRYVGDVRPQLHLPQAKAEPKAADPRQLREHLARSFSNTLYRMNAHPRPRDSVAFLAEATRVLQERLEQLPALTLELLTQDPELRTRFLRESIGAQYQDYLSHMNFGCGLGSLTPTQAAASWRPIGERPDLSDLDDEET